jgi:putative protease
VRISVKLKDSRTGAKHPVVVDVGFRNTVFSAETNSVADDIPRFIDKGVPLSPGVPPQRGTRSRRGR